MDCSLNSPVPSLAVPRAPAAPKWRSLEISWEKGVFAPFRWGDCSPQQWVSLALYPSLSRCRAEETHVRPPSYRGCLGCVGRNYFCTTPSHSPILLFPVPHTPCLRSSPNLLTIGQSCWSAGQPPTWWWGQCSLAQAQHQHSLLTGYHEYDLWHIHYTVLSVVHVHRWR